MAFALNGFSSLVSSNRRLLLHSQSSPLSHPRRRFLIRAAEIDASEVKSPSPDKSPAPSGSSFNQLLGIKGAARETEKWKIRLQLTKPVSWPPLVWGVVCGAAASGNFHWNVEDVAKSIICMIMSGPCLTGYAQSLNDWYDREIDAINEPYRPIPSGALSEGEVIIQIWMLLLGGLSLAALLDVWAGHNFPIIFYLALGGSLMSYVYSARPLKVSGVTTIELNVNMHCEACAQQLKSKILKMRGVQSAETELSSGKVTVTGTMDADRLVDYVYRHTRKQAKIVRQPTEQKEEGGKEGEKPAEEAAKEEKKEETAEKKEETAEEKKEEEKAPEQGGEKAAEGGEESKKEGEEVINNMAEMANKMMYWQSVYVIERVPPPQLFSDENPNACCIS